MSCEQRITVTQEPNEQNVIVDQEQSEQDISVDREPITIQKVTAGVLSVNGKTGVVTLDADDVGAIGDEEIVDFTYDEWEQLWQTY